MPNIKQGVQKKQTLPENKKTRTGFPASPREFFERSA
jgi:hypothetical protein